MTAKKIVPAEGEIYIAKPWRHTSIKRLVTRIDGETLYYRRINKAGRLLAPSWVTTVPTFAFWAGQRLDCSKTLQSAFDQLPTKEEQTRLFEPIRLQIEEIDQ